MDNPYFIQVVKEMRDFSEITVEIIKSEQLV